MKEDVLWLEVIMYYLPIVLVEEAQGADELLDYPFGVTFWQGLTLFEKCRKVGAIAILKHSAKGVGVDFDRVKVGDDVRMRKRSMNLILPQGVPYVVRLQAFRPSRIELMDFARDLPDVLAIKGLVDF